MESLTSETICAISTPAGRGGIAVARISGPDAITIAQQIWKGKPLDQTTTHTAHLGTITDTATNTPLDQAVATIFRAPNSFTGENIVEISVHGSTYIQTRLLELLTSHGARIAQPGEFTRRAFLNGRLDLAEAEAVADVIASSSRAAHSLAISQLQGKFSATINSLRQSLIELASLLELELDFSEEDVTFADRNHLRTLATTIRTTVGKLTSTFASADAIAHGVPVAIVGRPNAGKSQLLNTLLDTDRAIVSDIAGTTRDTVEDTTQINGITIRFVDTAGLRSTDDPIETLGIQRSYQSAAQARIILWVIDPAEAQSPQNISNLAQNLSQTKHPDSQIIPLLNKTDLLNAGQTSETLQTIIQATNLTPYPISAKNGDGTDSLRSLIADIATGDLPSDESLIVTNARHYAALRDADNELSQLLQGMSAGLTPDLLAEHLRAAIAHLGTITGAITSQTLLTTIFSKFCIGK